MLPLLGTVLRVVPVKQIRNICSRHISGFANVMIMRKIAINKNFVTVICNLEPICHNYFPNTIKNVAVVLFALGTDAVKFVPDKE